MHFDDQSKLINNIAYMAKRSFERAAHSRLSRHIPPEQWEQALLALESIKWKVSSFYRMTFYSEEQWMEGRNNLVEAIISIVNDDDLREVFAVIPFRPFVERDRPVLERLGLSDPKVSVLKSLDVLINQIDLGDHLVPVADSVSKYEAIRLRKIVPEQKLSPLKFEIVQGKVVIQNQPASAGGLDQQAADAARERLVEQGAALIEQLNRSNCDPRLAEKAKEVQNQLSGNKNIIQLGISNILLGSLQNAFEKELPDAINAILQAQTMGIGMYVSQYPDWQRFVENSAKAEVDDEQIGIINESVTDLIEVLDGAPEVVSEEVPRSIAKIKSLLDDRRSIPKRAVFALIRSVENLVSSIFRYGALLIEKSAQKTIETLSSTVSRLAAVALLGAGLAGANALLPLSVSMGELSWVRGAVEIVRNQIKNLE